MIGRYFSIEEFSVYDGPGIRTTVFLKGCPLRCSWCHNPEGQSHEIEIVRSPNGCRGCKECERLAECDDGKMRFTTESIDACPLSLLRVCGKDTEPEELCTLLLKNERILKNGGGVTFSGGEPLAQSEFVFECLSLLRGKLHTAIQTCGYCSEEVFAKALSLADYFLFDLKIIDSREHQKHTGVPNERILKNFTALARSGVDFTVRMPLIPTVSDTERNITAAAELLHSENIEYIELLPYNRMAGGKYEMLLREYRPSFDESAECNARLEIFDSFGIKAKLL